MKIRSMLATAVVLLLVGALPVSAQMMGGGGQMMGGDMMGMMGMMGGGASEGATTGCPGMSGQAAAFGDERPWISFALAHEKELGLTADQVKELTALRDEFQKEAVRLANEIRAARVKTMEKGSALLTEEQRGKLTSLTQTMRRMHGASMMGGAPGSAR